MNCAARRARSSASTTPPWRARRGADPADDNAGDPVLDPAIAAYTAAFDSYAPTALGYRTERPYRVAAARGVAAVELGWRARGEGGLGLALSSLEDTLLLHPNTRLLIVNGRYDLVTPYLASRWLVDQLAVPAAVRAAIGLRVYEGGHMMYMRPQLARRAGRRCRGPLRHPGCRAAAVTAGAGRCRRRPRRVQRDRVHERDLVCVCGLAAVDGAVCARSRPGSSGCFSSRALPARWRCRAASSPGRTNPTARPRPTSWRASPARSRHGGVVAVAAAAPAAAARSRSSPRVWARDGRPLLILDGIGNPHNLGAIVRSAAYFGVVRIVLADRPEQALPSAASYRIAEGALDRVTLYRAPLSAALPALKPALSDRRHRARTRRPGLPRLRRDRPVALILGNEESGVDPAILALCDTVVTIPGSGRVQSLECRGRGRGPALRPDLGMSRRRAPPSAARAPRAARRRPRARLRDGAMHERRGFERRQGFAARLAAQPAEACRQGGFNTRRCSFKSHGLRHHSVFACFQLPSSSTMPSRRCRIVPDRPAARRRGRRR